MPDRTPIPVRLTEAEFERLQWRESTSNRIGKLEDSSARNEERVIYLTAQMDKKVNKDVFDPVKLIVYALTGTAGTGLMGFIMKMVLSGHGS